MDILMEESEACGRTAHSTPAVSVIVGTYNCSQFLPGLWATLAGQTFRDFEVIVVDDASDDGDTLRALEKVGESIRLIRRPINSGTCELPRYQGVQAAKAPLCAFLDADDRWDPTFLARCVEHMQSHPDAAMVHSMVRVVDDADHVLRIRHEGAMPDAAQMKYELFKHCYITISATVVRREVWLEALSEEEINDFGMDLDFFVRIASQYPIGFIPEVLASYRRSSSSVSVKNWRRAPRNIHTLRRIYRKGYWQGVIDEATMIQNILDACLENVNYWRDRKRTGRSLWFVWQGLRIQPLSGTIWWEGAKTVGKAVIGGRSS
jgi:glycosyltransferase involved in cell wall biosynthesis